MGANMRTPRGDSSGVFTTPKSFEKSMIRLKDFIGNQTLVNLIKKTSLPQSSLFAGPEGIGKKTLALALAAKANCASKSLYDICGHCESCIKASKGNHPDILLWSASKHSIGIEAMRELTRESHYRPFQSSFRIFIVDQAEKMTREAANSILKTLEEPAETNRIILTTAFPDQLLPTIRSRCQLFAFKLLSLEQVIGFLKPQFGQDEAQQRATFSGGSIGKALELNLEVFLEDRARLIEILEKWLAKYSFIELFETCEKEPFRSDLKNRNRVREYFHILRQLGEDLYFLQTQTESRMINWDCQNHLRQLAKITDLDWIQNFLYHLNEACGDLERNVQPLFCFETFWLKTVKRVRHA